MSPYFLINPWGLAQTRLQNVNAFRVTIVFIV